MEGSFSKNCSVCNKKFTDLKRYMDHIKNNHKDISPEDLLKMGKEHKWKFRGQ